MCTIKFDEYGLCYQPCLDNLKIMSKVAQLLQMRLRMETELFKTNYERWPSPWPHKKIKFDDQSSIDRYALEGHTEKLRVLSWDFWAGHDVEHSDYREYLYYGYDLPAERLDRYTPQQMTLEQQEGAAQLWYIELIKELTK